MIHQTRNHREARAHFRSGQRGPGMIFRPVIGGYVVFDTVEEARGHQSTVIDLRAARIAKGDVL